MRWYFLTIAYLVGGLASSLTVTAAFADTRIPLPVITKGKGDKCVEPTDVMRRDHMNYILHQRDETVLRGIRTKRHSLVECIECHAKEDEKGQAISINAPDQFCGGCHRYAAVKIDCFQCHATTPDSGFGNMDHVSGMADTNDKKPATAGIRDDRFLKVVSEQGR